jgi:hypothetical protein
MLGSVSFVAFFFLVFTSGVAHAHLGGRSNRDLSDAVDAATATCRIYEAFVKTVQVLNDPTVPGKPWGAACAVFDGLDGLLCPGADSVAEMCAASNPPTNPTIKNLYCKALFEELEDVSNDVDTDDVPLKGDCVIYCVNYVSQNRGDCCNLNCI